ncbi:MAG TPA: hypothetical protein VN238_10790 [Solirubrobacteraceae bacterium]|nr:hypothetical protein [Solirubrobacteraceae bacterium]
MNITKTGLAALAAASLALTACGADTGGESKPAHAAESRPLAGEGKIVDISDGAPAATTPAEAPPIATVQGSEPGTTASLLRLQRVGKVVTVVVRLTQTADGDYIPHLEGEDGESYSAEGLRLVDEFNGREHFPLRDTEGECLCSRQLDEFLYEGDSVDVTAKFAAPPGDVDRVSLYLPEFASFDAIPLAP